MAVGYTHYDHTQQELPQHPQRRVLDRAKMVSRLYALGGPEAPRGSRPHLGQQMFHHSSARFKVSVWGRRGGKSFSGAIDPEPDMFAPWTDGFPPRGWIVAPNYELGEREFRVMWRHLVEELKVPVDYKFFRRGSGGQMAIRTAWGAEIWVKSAERPDAGLLGEGLSFVIMSEAARHNRSTWDQYIEPALADRNGRAIFTTTPQGTNWLKILFDRGQSADFPDWESWQFPSWVNTIRFPGGLRFLRADERTMQPLEPWVEVPWERVAASPDLSVVAHPDSSPKLVNSWRTLSRHYFWQEYGAQFRTQAGRVYPDFDPGYHVGRYPFVRGRRNYRTIDYGTTNPFVCLDVQVDEQDNVYVWREQRRSGFTTVENVRWAGLPHQLGYDLETVVGDPYEPDGRLTTENEWGVPVNFVTIGVKNGIEIVTRFLKLQPSQVGPEEPARPKLFIDESCTAMIEEMQAYRYKETVDEEAATDSVFILRDDKNPVEEPLKANDHAPDALRNLLAWLYGSEYVHTAVNEYEAHNEDDDQDQYEYGGFGAEGPRYESLALRGDRWT